MNLRRSFDGPPRIISLVAGAACCLIATTLSAQSYGPRYGAASMPATGAMPASHRIPMLSARPQTQSPYCPPGEQPSDYMPRPQMPSTQPGQRQLQPPRRDDAPQRPDATDPSRQQPQQDQQSQQPQ